MPSREEVAARLRDDYLYYAPRALKIVAKSGDVVAFRLKRPQARLNLALMRQREAGLPQRAIILKARQVGFSTDAQGLIIQRATQIPNHKALVVAHTNKTAGELFDIGRFMWANLPEQIRPVLAYERNSVGGQKLMQFGEAAQSLRRRGVLGLNSSIDIETAKEATGGRGLTRHSLHCSEVAFWDQPAKLTALANTVPEEAHTLALLESTANGLNFFRDLWDQAEAGVSGYFASFTPWFEEDTYRRPFANADDRADFEEQLGAGDYGEDEPDLLTLIPESLRAWEREFEGTEFELAAMTDDEVRTRTLEHLYWRRLTIAGPRCGGSIDTFHQEYPSTAEEAFLSTGRKVFAPELVRKVIRAVAVSDPVLASDGAPGPRVGAFLPGDEKMVRSRRGSTLMVPQRAVWRPRAEVSDEDRRRAHWRVWEDPVREALDPLTGRKVPSGQYIVFVDPASGEEDDAGEHAAHGIQVIDHRTLVQVAELESKLLDADEVADEALLVALFFNRAWIGVEKTGGYGLSILRRLVRDYRYPRVYRQQIEARPTEHDVDRLGWSTDPATKPMMLDRGIELLRTDTHGIRSRRLAMQLQTYVRDKRGRTKPEAGKLADLLMAWLGAQAIAERRPVRPDRPPGATSTRPVKMRV